MKRSVHATEAFLENEKFNFALLQKAKSFSRMRVFKIEGAFMRKLLLSLTLLVLACAAWAHPTDDMLLSRIGKGTKIIFKQDINIPPFYQYFGLEYGQVIPYLTADEKPCHGCFLYMFSAMSIDRLIKAGRTVEIVDMSNYYGTLLSLKFPSDVPFTVVCDPANMSIGDFKQEVLDILEVQLPAPVEI